MKQRKQSLKTKSPRPAKRRNQPGIRLRTGVKAGAVDMEMDTGTYGEVIWG